MKKLKTYESFEPEEEWEEEYGDECKYCDYMNPEFVRFLIEKDALDKYEKNFIDYNYGNIDIIRLMVSIMKTPKMAISMSFEWYLTPEGSDYWRDLSIEWGDRFEGINESFEPEEEWEEEDETFVEKQNGYIPSVGTLVMVKPEYYYNDRYVYNKIMEKDSIGIVTISNNTKFTVMFNGRKCYYNDIVQLLFNDSV